MKLAVLEESNNYYTLYVYDIERGKFVKSITLEGFENIVNFVEDDYMITFENNDMSLTEKIKNYFPENKLLSEKNIFNSRVYGVCMTKNVHSYGYDLNIVRPIMNASNICKYLVLKNQGL